MLSDTMDFERRIAGAESALQRFFDASGPVILTRAPGRLDVIGGVADYSGSLVAEATIGEATHVAMQLRQDAQVRVWSRSFDSRFACVEASVDDLKGEARQVGFRLRRDESARWATYVLGCFTVLFGAGQLGCTRTGANIVIESDIPLSSGLSSSAALEVAAMQALSAAFGLDLDPATLAVLAQRVENDVVGAPCGIMDQMASTLGRPQSLLLLLCQPHEVQGYSNLPADVRIFGINSAVSHSVSGSPYARARIAAFMGRKLINERRLLKGEAPVKYLCEVTPTRYRRDYSAILPGKVTGRQFLETAGSHEDAATTIDPEGVYPVRASTEHAIYENARVKTFLSCMDEAGRSSASQQTMALIRAGMAMYGSHWSYTRIGLGCRETTMITRMLREAGPSRGIFGAKITGGGSGGVVAVLASGEDAAGAVEEVAREYARVSGNNPKIVVGGKSPGAAAFGSRFIALP